MNESVSVSLQLAWFCATVLLIMGLRQLSSPTRARQGIWFAGIGMLLAIGSMFFHPLLNANLPLIILAMANDCLVQRFGRHGGSWCLFTGIAACGRLRHCHQGAGCAECADRLYCICRIAVCLLSATRIFFSARGICKTTGCLPSLRISGLFCWFSLCCWQ